MKISHMACYVLRSIYCGLLLALAVGDGMAQDKKPDTATPEMKPKIRKTSDTSFEIDARTIEKLGLVRQGYFGINEKAYEDKIAQIQLKPFAKNGGMTLGVDLSYEHNVTKDEDFIVFEWSLGYSGECKCRNIALPSLGNPAREDGELELDLSALGQDGKVYSITYLEIGLNEKYRFDVFLRPLRKEDEFVTLHAGAKKNPGKLRLSLGMIHEDLALVAAGQFDTKQCPALYGTMTFKTSDRAERFDKDAWTGTLRSNMGTMKGQLRTIK